MNCLYYSHLRPPQQFVWLSKQSCSVSKTIIMLWCNVICVVGQLTVVLNPTTQNVRTIHQWPSHRKVDEKATGKVSKHSSIPRQLYQCKKAFVILTIAFVIRVATVDQNSPLWQPVQHTWSTGTAEVFTGAGRHQISAIHNKRALFPCKEP